jgi:hypothetical protein
MNVATVVMFESEIELSQSQMNRISNQIMSYLHAVVLVNEEIKAVKPEEIRFVNTHQHETSDGPCGTCSLIRNIAPDGT